MCRWTLGPIEHRWGHGFSDTVNPRVVVGPDSWSSIILFLLLYVQVNWRYAGRITTEVEYPLLPDSTPASVFGFAAIAGPRRPGPITGTHAALSPVPERRAPAAANAHITVTMTLSSSRWHVSCGSCCFRWRGGPGGHRCHSSYIAGVSPRSQD